MTIQAHGTFEVTMTPQVPDDATLETPVNQLSLSKVFRGDLMGTSIGQMLSVTTGVAGSAGYVAIEYITGILNGRCGRFALQHNGTLTRGLPQLSVTVVPDSGSDDLLGLTGTLAIAIIDGVHHYTLDYILPLR